MNVYICTNTFKGFSASYNVTAANLTMARLAVVRFFADKSILVGTITVERLRMEDFEQQPIKADNYE